MSFPEVRYSGITLESMEELISTENPPPNEKIYSSKAILVSTFWAGPVVGGYMLSENFKIFGERTRAIWALVIPILGIVLLTAVSLTTTFLDVIPNLVFPMIFTWIFYISVRVLMGEKIDSHFSAGGGRVALGKVILVGAIGAVLTFGMMFGASYAYLSATDKSVTKYFGPLKHEIQYQQGNITEEEVDRLGKALTDTTYFDAETQKFVDVRKDGGKYELFLYCDESIKKDSRIYEAYIGLRTDVQKLFPDNKVVINLVIGTQDNVVKRLE